MQCCCCAPASHEKIFRLKMYFPLSLSVTEEPQNSGLQVLHSTGQYRATVQEIVEPVHAPTVKVSQVHWKPWMM